MSISPQRTSCANAFMVRCDL